MDVPSSSARNEDLDEDAEPPVRETLKSGGGIGPVLIARLSWEAAERRLERDEDG